MRSISSSSAVLGGGGVGGDRPNSSRSVVVAARRGAVSTRGGGTGRGARRRSRCPPSGPEPSPSWVSRSNRPPACRFVSRPFASGRRSSANFSRSLRSLCARNTDIPGGDDAFGSLLGPISSNRPPFAARSSLCIIARSMSFCTFPAALISRYIAAHGCESSDILSQRSNAGAMMCLYLRSILENSRIVTWPSPSTSTSRMMLSRPLAMPPTPPKLASPRPFRSAPEPTTRSASPRKYVAPMTRLNSSLVMPPSSSVSKRRHAK